MTYKKSPEKSFFSEKGFFQNLIFSICIIFPYLHKKPGRDCIAKRNLGKNCTRLRTAARNLYGRQNIDRYTQPIHLAICSPECNLYTGFPIILFDFLKTKLFGVIMSDWSQLLET